MTNKKTLTCLTNFNTTPITSLAGTFCKCMNIPAPKFATSIIPELCEKLLAKTSKGFVDRVMIYNPDAIAQWIFEKYHQKFETVEKIATIQQPLLSVIPPKTPVCFASIYSGATPAQHGIQKYTKPVLAIDTLFDALIRAGKKPCIISVAEQSMDKIFRERKMDYFSLKDDASAVNKAIEIIASDKYDFICVYNQEFDSVMHISYPESKKSLQAIDHYALSFQRLVDAVKTHWSTHDSLVGMATDHGVHTAWYRLGQHGNNITKDMNIMHFYDIIPQKHNC